MRTLVTVTPERLFQRLQALGFGLRESGDYYGYSLALGSADVSLLALTNAYRALANQGRASAVRTSLGDPIVKPRQVMDPAAAFIISDILADRSARAVTFGLENALAGRVPAAVKTGTSKDMRDNWCIGYSARYTVGVWVGNASGAPMWDVSGVTGAAPIWQEVMQFLHATPAGPGAFGIGLWRAAGWRQGAQHPLPGSNWKRRAASISCPAPNRSSSHWHSRSRSGRRSAIRPPACWWRSIPTSRPRTSACASSRKAWRMAAGCWMGNCCRRGKGKGAASADLAYDWMPWPGRHTLALVDGKNAVVDQVRFEVRGAVEKAKPPANGKR